MAFDEKYFPDSVRERKKVEFIELQQGGMTVEQYASKFAELSRYTPHIININTRKAAKFERGLRSDIRGRVLLANLKLYSPLVDLALKIERDYEDHRSRKEGKMKVVPSRKFGKKPRQIPRRDVREGAYKNFPGNRENDRHPVCPHCRKDNHSSVTESRIYATGVAGLRCVSICGIKARALIDSGSSHSFVAPHFAYYLNVEPTCLDYTLTVCTPVEDSMETDRVYRKCGITIDMCDLPVDLILLEIQDFDVILSMDWLYTHYATVNCHEKKVTFKRPAQAELHFEGTRDTSPLHFISTLRASRLLTKRSEGIRPMWLKSGRPDPARRNTSSERVPRGLPGRVTIPTSNNGG
ncbi:uncharacterized protein LOC105421034 [Amborella trichopoda]|uniref:uncharacterized protein LOC105421034 n=1 Tax=Amborella trichopoda TaxID=13333 RepID=UPI0005D35578|nr:uncharacterized protein LOC105421034 [Amborella trichopoda]|eukprot:XP_011625197.1 uncharacterized protein LOC105421034 [Amborella trichopoda]